MEIFLEKIEDFVKTYKVLLIILAVTFIIRLPSLFEPLWYGDEAIYLTIGQRLLRGDLLYVDIFDHKTPGIYYLAAWAIEVLGESIWSLRFLLMAWVSATLVIFYFLGKKLFDKKIALVATMVLAALTSTPLIEGNIVNSEILMIAPISLGVIFGLRGRLLLASISFSLAVLIKFPAVFDLAAFAAYLTLTIQRNTIKKTVSRLFTLSAGVAFPILLTAVYFAANGHLSDYFKSAFLFNVAYTSYKNNILIGSFNIENGLLLLKALPLFSLLIYFAVRVYSRLKAQARSALGVYEFLILWLVFSFYGASFGGRAYEHYLIQAVPPFSLIAAASIYKKGFRKIGAFCALATIVLVLILGFRPYVAPSYYLNFFRYSFNQIDFDTYAAGFNPKTARNYALAAFLTGCEQYDKEKTCRQTRTNKGDSLYIYANEPSIYFLSDLDPASKYITFFHIAGNDQAKQEAFNEIERSDPEYILVEIPLPGSFESLEEYLGERYNLFALYESVAIFRQYRP